MHFQSNIWTTCNIPQSHLLVSFLLAAAWRPLIAPWIALLLSGLCLPTKCFVRSVSSVCNSPWRGYSRFFHFNNLKPALESMDFFLASSKTYNGLESFVLLVQEKMGPCKNLDNFHLYLWLLKDLSWAQDWYYCGMIFGSLAVVWSFLMILCAIKSSATNEIFISVALFLWYRNRN